MQDGYAFTVNRKLNEKVISWKCTGYKQHRCCARAVTKLVNNLEYVKMTKPVHNHEPDLEMVYGLVA